MFTAVQEQALKEYLLKSSYIYFGLTPQDVKRLAYAYAKKLNIKYPSSWNTHEEAGKDWFTNFMNRHKELSLRKAQNTSYNRILNFNKKNVESFYNVLQKVLNDLKLGPGQIFNMDETGLSTVQNSPKVISRRGIQQVGVAASGERGEMITMAIAVNALGNTIPPMFIFRRAVLREYYYVNGPPGCIAAANTSGWMQQQEFVQFINHFIDHSGCSKKRPMLLLVDNHDSHMSIEALDIAAENGLTLLSFPPHCTHRLQPLDRSVFGPLKNYFNKHMKAWITNNPGKKVQIYTLPQIVDSILPLALTPSNIKHGFECTGIYPFNPTTFSDADFVTVEQSVEENTEQNTEQNTAQNPIPSTSAASMLPSYAYDPVHNQPAAFEEVSSSASSSIPQNATLSELSASLEDIRELPKIQKHKRTRGRQPMPGNVILTSSPERKRLRQLAVKRAERKQKLQKRQEKKILEQSIPKKTTKKSKSATDHKKNK